MSSSPSLLGRAVLAIVLMIGFYALAIATAGVLLYLPYAEVRYAHRLDIRLAIFCLVGAGIIMWSILPRRDRFIPPGPCLAPNQHPRLFAQLTGVAQVVSQAMPAEVYLVPEVNAWVAQRGGIMGLGSRRVMGLGLPLLQILTVSQLRAVLAHEFGHFYGGDTKLGPWVYKTRAAIERTLQGLAKADSALRFLFLWYGKMFLRVTHAISRRQELSADALASRTVGSRPLIEGLRAIHGASLAYPPYWATEAVPVLGAGYRPPLAEGFGRFVRSTAIAEAMDQDVATEIKEAKPDPYNTHPPLRERIAAAESLPQGEPLTPDLPAISLVDNLDEVERRLLAAMAGEAQIQALKPVRWEDVGAEVYLPIWEKSVRENATALQGVTLTALPEAAKNSLDIGCKIPVPKGRLPAPEERAQMAQRLLGQALAVALARQGWILHALPGELYFQKDEIKLDPFMVASRLAADKLQPEAWREQCVAAGISDLDLGEAETSGQAT